MLKCFRVKFMEYYFLNSKFFHFHIFSFPNLTNVF
jgi:hypothetical protein